MLFPFLAVALLAFSTTAISNVKTSLTLLYQNNLNGTDDVNHVGFILLDGVSQGDAPGACSTIGESLVTRSQINDHLSDFASSFSYLVYTGRAHRVQQYRISDGVVVYTVSDEKVAFQSSPAKEPALPVLCTQSSNQNQPSNTLVTPANQISIGSSGNVFIGTRNQKSFRFLGIPFANPPKRWQYSTGYSPTGQTINATKYGPQCVQYGSGSESCLFLNVQTPYLPKQGSTTDLRPVLFWIHGGGFTGGSAADAGTDGGNLASREDIVVVQIQYRLGSLGFLAIPGTNISGNYGIADQIVALEWVIKNIAAFGGDPNRITIGGDSAGAGSVRALLGSPPAKGKFQGALAMSNLGGGATLGLTGSYSTTYSSYLSVSESYARAGQSIFTGAGCTQSTLDAQIACLKTVPATSISDAARYVVQDGFYVNTEQLIVSNHNGSTAYVPVAFGVVADDGASIGAGYPTVPVTSESTGLQTALGISAKYAQDIIDSGLFPLYSTGNLTLDSFNVSARVSTDIGFRCIDEATVYAGSQSGAFPAAYFFQMERAMGGYDPSGLGGPAVTLGYPYGNPNLPYFKLHSGATAPFIFGNVSPIRDEKDLWAAQLNSGYFAQFVKDGQPNPSTRYLEKRGYQKTLEAVQSTGRWGSVRGKSGPVRLLDYPSIESEFPDAKQCAWLKYPLSYYLDGGL